ncbi:hypothetical protein MMC24_001818 [Lignoscripta atroalba]|nr:hypothetical protein [Lignoscripta atroalba]
MPVSHIGLVVSHLPTSCSFFLAALSPLGYRYIGQQDNQIGFGIHNADFFICQESPGVKPGAAHIAFSAPSRSAVVAFFTAALKAGGRIHGEPALRDPETGYYSAAVLDYDHNSIEVVHRDEDDNMSRTTISDRPEGSRVLTWQKDVARSTANGRSSTGRTPSRTLVHNITMPTVVVSQAAAERTSNDDMSSKNLIGTLLGAAAGAAIAYAMTKGEAESTSRPETAWPRTTTVYQAIEAAQSSPGSVITTISEPRYQQPSASTHSPSTIYPRSHHSSSRPRAIEAPPLPNSRSTLIETFIPPTEVARYTTAPSSRSNITRSHTDTITIRSSTSHCPKPPSRASSTAKTITQADFPPPAARPSSSHSTNLSRRDIAANSKSPTHISITHSHSHQPTPSHISVGKTISKPPSLAGSILGLGSVAPSDSISQAPSKKSRSRHSRASTKDRPSLSSSRRSSSRRSSSHHLVVVGGGGDGVLDDDDDEDEDVVAPEDSISQVGSEARRTVVGGKVMGSNNTREQRSVVSLPFRSEPRRESAGREREVRSVIGVGFLAGR